MRLSDRFLNTVIQRLIDRLNGIHIFKRNYLSVDPKTLDDSIWGNSSASACLLRPPTSEGPGSEASSLPPRAVSYSVWRLRLGISTSRGFPSCFNLLHSFVCFALKPGEQSQRADGVGPSGVPSEQAKCLICVLRSRGRVQERGEHVSRQIKATRGRDELIWGRDLFLPGCLDATRSKSMDAAGGH